MLLDLSEIVIREGMKSRVDVDQGSLPEPDLKFVEPVVGHVNFQNSGDLISIGGNLKTVVEIACARCLADVRVPLEVKIDERIPIDDITHPDRPQDEDAGFETIVSSVVHLDAGKPIFDLDEFMRQQVLTEVPIRALCGAACRGLCPNCGADLNQGPCACPQERENSPLSALAALLEGEGNAANSDGN